MSTPYTCPVCQITYEDAQPLQRVAVQTESGPVLRDHTFHDAAAIRGCCPTCAAHRDNGTGELVGCPISDCPTCGDTEHGVVLTQSKGGPA